MLERSRSLSALTVMTRTESGVEGQSEVDKMEAANDNTATKKSRRCHQCHTPLAEQVHVGVKTGVGVCPLPHWEGCERDIPKGDEAKGKIWAPCPEESLSSEDTDDDKKSVDDSDPDYDPEVEITGKGKLFSSVAEAAAALDNSTKVKPLPLSTALPVNAEELTRKDSISSSSDDGEFRAKQQQIEKLEKQIREQKGKEAAADLAKIERKNQRRLKRQREIAALEEKEKLLQKQIQNSKVVNPPKSSPTVPDLSTHDQKRLNDQVAEHEARRQRRAAEKKAKQKEHSVDLTIDEIRKLPEVQRQALDLMSKLQNMIPSLAADPNAGSGNVTSSVQAGSALPQHGVVQQPEPRYVYVASLGRAVPVVDTPADITDMQGYGGGDRHSSLDTDSEEECSADEDCPLSPEPGQRFSWRKYSDGSKYFVPIQVKKSTASLMVWTYVLDAKTGRYEKCQVPAQSTTDRQAVKKSQHVQSKKVAHGCSSPKFVDHRVQLGMAGRAGSRQSQLRREERQPTYVCPDVQSEKQGKELRIPELVHYARECPVSWTSKVTTDKLNPILWSWAYVSQLLATRTGQAPKLGEGELEARLQHFLSVLEITLQTTTQADFSADAWKVARLYHVKVQQKIDNGDYSWIQMQKQWGAATSPHELMAARAEIPIVKQLKSPLDGTGTGRGGTGRGAKGGKKDDDDDEKKKKQVCYSWNNSEVKGKCKWEMEHDGETCIRMHICSWCKSKDLKPQTHQKRFCRRRIEEEGE